MKKKVLFKKICTQASVVFSCLSLTACMTQNAYTGEKEVSDTTIGTGIGAVSGAAIGALAHGTKGALIGAGIGSLVGGTVGYALDREHEELRKVLVGTGVQVQKNGNMITLIMPADVTFKTNVSDVNSRVYPTLNSVALVLNKYKNNNIVITGFTDNVGNAAYNQELSERRAQSVADYLASQHIASNRIIVRGMGMRNPAADNKTAAGRARNRRVELTLS